MENYTGNGNKPDLTDSNYYYKGQQDDDDFEKLITKQITGSYNIQLEKVDKDNNSTKLSGAVFSVTLPGQSTTNKTTRQKNFALLRFENCFEGELTFENGLPLTTKGDTDYHGYGLKSIRRTAQKYGGTVTVNTRKNWFELKILLPLEDSSAAQ